MKEFEPTHAAKHICNSHMPTLKPKIAKELVCLPTLFCRPGKQNLDSAKIENIMTVNKAQQVTSCIVHLADSANIESVTSNKLCNGLTGSCFESPNDTIHVTVQGNPFGLPLNGPAEPCVRVVPEGTPQNNAETALKRRLPPDRYAAA